MKKMGYNYNKQEAAGGLARLRSPRRWAGSGTD